MNLALPKSEAARPLASCLSSKIFLVISLILLLLLLETSILRMPLSTLLRSETTPRYSLISFMSSSFRGSKGKPKNSSLQRVTRASWPDLSAHAISHVSLSS